MVRQLMIKSANRNMSMDPHRDHRIPQLRWIEEPCFCYTTLNCFVKDTTTQSCNVSFSNLPVVVVLARLSMPMQKLGEDK